VIDLNAISDGLDLDEFFLEYMPTIDLDDGRCVGAEALIRWQRPTGIVPPGEFIPIVENTPLSGVITYWVMETAARELGNWLRQHDDIHLGINVPPEILGRGGLEYAATKSGLKEVADKIVLEVTERGVPDRLGVDALAQAARRGVRIALDDVNVSAANLVVMSRCHIEVIKLDRTLVGELGSGGGWPEWLKGLEAVLQTTKLEVIAEGVETARQREVLRDAGIRMGQGYLFSRPLRAEAFLAYFNAHR
jgi:EAL domain-containing protein (putative c-di-GMP-specific phosphodiesterase class I)